MVHYGLVHGVEVSISLIKKIKALKISNLIKMEVIRVSITAFHKYYQ